MRMILGLDNPTQGEVTVNGKRYAEHSAPLHEVGALLEAKAVHTGRSAYHHLLALAFTHGISRKRVDEVIDLVGLRDVAGKRVGGFSLGMGQRLGVACALLADPATLVLDEPVNGLDPEGILWIRTLMRGLAAQGRTVFVSSHLMSEMALTAEHLVVIGRGRLIADVSVAEFTESASRKLVRVRTPMATQLRDLLVGPQVTVSGLEPGLLEVTGADSAAIGTLACRHAIPLIELTPVQASLEAAFMALTQDAVEYHASPTERVAS
jgi:ABC-2 type transport system ATP-binding protein